METLTVVNRSPFILPGDPFIRAATLRARIGTRVILHSGDFSLEGILVTVVAPAQHAENPSPVVIIDTGLERVAGPVLDGDRLA